MRKPSCEVTLAQPLAGHPPRGYGQETVTVFDHLRDQWLRVRRPRKGIIAGKDKGFTMSDGRVFLTADWNYLAMLNFEVDPAILQPHVPPGTELDAFEGRHFVSLVGFLFRNTKVLGLPIPLHRHFEEINLRFYVRYRAAEGWRRGVTFVKEIVPRRAIAWVARWLYEEPYVALPTAHDIEWSRDEGCRPRSVAYRWHAGPRWNHLRVWPEGEAQPLVEGSLEEFISEHYWGYTARRGGDLSEYRVSHPAWNVWQVPRYELDCSAAELYGQPFEAPLQSPASSVFLADGSPIAVHRGIRHASKGAVVEAAESA